MESTDSHARRDLLVLVPIAGFCLFAWLGAGSLKTFDEARHGEVAREVFETGVVHTLHWNHTRYLAKPPLNAWVTALLFKVFGVHELTVRLFSATCGLATVLLTWWLGRRLVGPRAALYGALVLCTSTFFLKYARLGQLDGPLTFLTTLGLCLYWRARETPRLTPWLGVVLAAALLLKSVAGFAFTAVLVVHALLGREPGLLRRKAFWIPIAAAVAVGGSWVLLQYGLYGGVVVERWRYDVVKRATEVVEGHEHWIGYYPLEFALRSGVWGPLGLIALAALARALLRQMDQGLLLLLTWALTIFGAYMAAQSQALWYVLPAAPAVSLATGWFLHRRFPGLRPRTAALLFAGCVAMQLCGTALFVRKNFLSMDFEPEIRALAERTRSRVGREDTVFAFEVHENALLFYNGRRVARAQDVPTIRTFAASVRSRGKRLCFVREPARPRLEGLFPPDLGATVLDREGSLLLLEVEVRNARGPEPMGVR